MPSKGTGPIAREIRELCFEISDGRICDEDYKERLRGLLDEHGNRFQAFGLAIDKQLELSSRKQEIWKLTDEVEPRIRQAVRNWANKTLKSLGGPFV